MSTSSYVSIIPECSIFEKLNGVTGIYFGGGDQSLLTKDLLGTKLLEGIKIIYDSGGVISGTSAGAAVMSEVMITGNELINQDSTRAFIDIKKDNIDDSWFEDNMDYFKYYGRDMETLFSKVKIAHSRRVFCLDESEKKVITKKDLEKGFSQYLENDNIKSRKTNKDIEKHIMYSMYS